MPVLAVIPIDRMTDILHEGKEIDREPIYYDSSSSSIQLLLAELYSHDRESLNRKHSVSPRLGCLT